MTFKESFKYYKNRKPVPDLTDVIDIENPCDEKVKKINIHAVNKVCTDQFGLVPTKDWKVYELLEIPGLIFIKNPFRPSGQQYWITKCLKEYSKKPNKLNIDAHNILNENESWWDICFGYSNKSKEILPKLRWATLGYHHDWDTKHYSEESKTEMPTEVSELTSILAQTLGYTNFKAEAAIINYYRMNSTLAGHTDHSEVNIEAPLFSISFGQSAIFLIGGHVQDDPASALFLHSGDIIVMSGTSRLRYHGVPKVIKTNKTPWNDEEIFNNICTPTFSNKDWCKAMTYISEARINMNIRQVLRPGQKSLN